MSNQTQTVRIRPIAASSANIYSLNAAVANVEYSQSLSNATKKFTIRVREGQATVKVAFALGGTATNDYITMKPNTVLSEDNLSLENVTVYVSSDTSGKTIEILEWT